MQIWISSAITKTVNEKGSISHLFFNRNARALNFVLFPAIYVMAASMINVIWRRIMVILNDECLPRWAEPVVRYNEDSCCSLSNLAIWNLIQIRLLTDHILLFHIVSISCARNFWSCYFNLEVSLCIHLPRLSTKLHFELAITKGLVYYSQTSFSKRRVQLYFDNHLNKAYFYRIL